MASRNFNRLQALEKEIKHLHMEVAIGGTGAPTLTSGLGIASISRTSAGLYQITLQDKYVRLMGMSIMQLVSSAEDLVFQVQAEDVDSAKTISFHCLAGGVATDPSSGSKLFIQIMLKNTTAGE